MSRYRPAPRRRQRRVRLVNLARRRDELPIVGELAEGYATVLGGAELLCEYDPAWFGTHVAHRPVTLPIGLGVVLAFLQKVDLEVVPLRWPCDYETMMYGRTLKDDLEPTPEATLVAFDGVDEEWLNATLRWFLVQPRPQYYGIGAQSIVTGDFLTGEVVPSAYSPLTVLLWHLFGTTGVTLGGLDWDLLGGLLAEQLVAIRPLPPETPIPALFARLQAARMPGFMPVNVTPDQLIRYAFGQTGNVLADYSTEEADQIDTDAWNWEQLPALRTQAIAAVTIAAAYDAWERQVLLVTSAGAPDTSGALRALRRVAGWLHREARAAIAATGGGTLITILARQEARAA